MCKTGTLIKTTTVFSSYFDWQPNILGDVFQVLYEDGTDETPVVSNNEKLNMFSGFRVAPE